MSHYFKEFGSLFEEEMSNHLDNPDYDGYEETGYFFYSTVQCNTVQLTTVKVLSKSTVLAVEH